MNKVANFLIAAFLFTLTTNAHSQAEKLIDVVAPSGLFNHNDTLIIGTYAGVSNRYDLKSMSTSESIFKSQVFRTTYHKGNLYYSDSWNFIFKYEMDTGLNSVLYGDGSNIFGITTYENDLYFSEWAKGEIYKINLEEESMLPELIYLGLDTLGALVEYNGKLYITESGTGSIFTLDLSSNLPLLDTVFFNEFAAPNELLVIDDHMYVSEFSANKISRFDLTDSSPIIQDVITDIVSPTGLTSDDKYLYISSLEENEVLRFPLEVIPPTDPEQPKGNVIIYPNPNYGKFSVSNLSKKEAYKIFDSNGKLVQAGIVGNNEEIQLPDKRHTTLFFEIKDSGLIRILVIQ